MDFFQYVSSSHLLAPYETEKMWYDINSRSTLQTPHCLSGKGVFSVLIVTDDVVAVFDGAIKNLFGDGILNMGLNGTSERSCTIYFIETGFGYGLNSGVGKGGINIEKKVVDSEGNEVNCKEVHKAEDESLESETTVETTV